MKVYKLKFCPRVYSDKSSRKTESVVIVAESEEDAIRIAEEDSSLELWEDDFKIKKRCVGFTIQEISLEEPSIVLIKPDEDYIIREYLPDPDDY